MRLSAKERRALRIFLKPAGKRSYDGIHANSVHSLERKGLLDRYRQLTKTGRAELKVPDVFADLLPDRGSAQKVKRLRALREPKRCDPDRALAAAEVLQAVWLSEKHFELEHEIGDPPVAEVDDEDRVWITVKIHVPALDVDLWLEGTHPDDPNNRRGDGDGDA